MQCSATAHRTGERCKNGALAGRYRCAMHEAVAVAARDLASDLNYDPDHGLDLPPGTLELAAMSSLPEALILDDDPPRSVEDILREAGILGLDENPPIEAVGEAVEKLAGLVQDEPPLRRELLREGAYQALKAVGVRAPTRLVDAALKDGEEEEGGRQGRRLVLEDPEPWPEPVDGADLLEEMVLAISRYVVLPYGGATAAALWVMHAHAHDASEVSPILAISSPEKRCGKTTLLHLLGALVPRTLPASNITAAALFRAVEKFHPTILVDEADTFLRDNEELRGVLNSGHARASAVVVRCAEPDWEPHAFSTWAPKAIALIGNLPSTLEDRSILLRLRRRAPDEPIERLRLDRLGELEPLRRQAARWARDHMRVLSVADPETPSELHDRAADNWRCLLAIADSAGGTWPQRARTAARTLAGLEAGDDGSVRILLLQDLRDLFDKRKVDRLPSTDIVTVLVKMEERPWPEWGHHSRKPITPTGVARLLRPFEVRPKTIKLPDGSTSKGYLREDLSETWERYIPTQGGGAQPSPPSPSSNDTENSGFANRNQGGSVTVSETGEKPYEIRKVTGVTAGKGGVAGNTPPALAPSTNGDERLHREERRVTEDEDAGSRRTELEAIRAQAEEDESDPAPTLFEDF